MYEHSKERKMKQTFVNTKKRLVWSLRYTLMTWLLKSIVSSPYGLGSWPNDGLLWLTLSWAGLVNLVTSSPASFRKFSVGLSSLSLLEGKGKDKRFMKLIYHRILFLERGWQEKSCSLSITRLQTIRNELKTVFGRSNLFRIAWRQWHKYKIVLLHAEVKFQVNVVVSRVFQ